MGVVIWWADPAAQASRAAFNAKAADELPRMRLSKPLRLSAADVPRKRRKFEQGSTLIVRARLSDGPEAA